MNIKRYIILIVVLAITIGGALWYLRPNPNIGNQLLQRLGLGRLEKGWGASGFVEAEEVAIAPEIAGRITALPFGEGDEARAGDVLLRLQDDILSAQAEAARGKLEEAQATLARVKAGTRKETLERFAAQVELAQAARDGARQAWLDAMGQ